MTEAYEVKRLHIGNYEEDEQKLYKIESERNDRILDAAKKWQVIAKRVFGKDQDFWKVAVPTQLYDTLGSIERGASIEAAKTFLFVHGFEVKAGFCVGCPYVAKCGRTKETLTTCKRKGKPTR